MFFCIITFLSFDVCVCRARYRTLYKNKQHKVPLFPMVMMTYSILSLGDRSTQVVFVQWGLVWQSFNTMEGHYMAPAVPLHPSPQQQLSEIIGSLKEEWRNELEPENKRSLEKMKQELKEAIKIELFQRVS